MPTPYPDSATQQYFVMLGTSLSILDASDKQVSSSSVLEKLDNMIEGLHELPDLNTEEREKVSVLHEAFVDAIVQTRAFGLLESE